MPPARANYQQRAGRAGRRGNTVATVVAFGSSDSHDEHYFSAPDSMIRGDVIDPKLTLDNREIVRRHMRAFLLQTYHQDRIQAIDTTRPHDLFSVLGTVSDFCKDNSILNRNDFAAWLAEHEKELRVRASLWIPEELSPADRENLLNEMKNDCLQAIDKAVGMDLIETEDVNGSEETNEGQGEIAPEVDDEYPNLELAHDKLLDRLLYCGKLPRYAFPTDVATFHVFDQDRSSRFRPIMRFAPSQGLPISLSQYAPGKQVWISGKCYTSGAIYSVMKNERDDAWKTKRMYMECSDCGFARTFDAGEVERGKVNDCEACGGINTFGPARYWFRPPGFAHPIDAAEETTPDNIPETSYATRAKLTMGTPDDNAGWAIVNERIRVLRDRQHLLVSNTGPDDEGYTYCLKCGRIEASNLPDSTLYAPHSKPYPDEGNQICDTFKPTRHMVLGTDFITDIALFSMRIAPPLSLKPSEFSTAVALRTISEALAMAACQMLEIEPSELMAEYRPALTQDGILGLEAEVFLYDTLPGGAGFSSQLPDRGQELFQRTLRLLKACPEECDASCYRCLRSFKNKFEHSLLDRHVGAELLDYLINGKPPIFNNKRLRESTKLLFEDLQRQSDGSMITRENVSMNSEIGTITAPILIEKKQGERFIVALSGPLSSDTPADTKIAELRNSGSEIPIIVENELVVRNNLPSATRKVQRALGI